MNTDTLIKTLIEPPCNWLPFHIYGIGPEKNADGFPLAVCEVRSTHATMKCIFSPDLPPETATRNMNYLMIAAVALGDTEAPKRILSMVKDANSRREDTVYEWSASGLQFKLDISFTQSMTTLEATDRLLQSAKETVNVT